MSTTEFLKTLTLDQLIFARDTAAEMIKAIREEEKKAVWRVTDRWMSHGNFRTEDYLKAIECFVRVATSNFAKCGDDVQSNREDLMLRIDCEMVPASEYEGWFE